MVVVSTAKTENLQQVEAVYTADVLQSNDIKIAIEKNPEYKKEAIIRNVTINNIQTNNPLLMDLTLIFALNFQCCSSARLL